MALKRKPKKLVVKGGGGSSGSETSPLRPYHLEKTAPCMNGCPQGTEIRKVLMTIAQAEKYEKPQEQAFQEAWEIITEKNPLPAVCGRVCPHPCEDDCNRKDKEGALAINNVERFLGDWALEHNFKLHVSEELIHPEKVAVIGAGPAGLACAYHMRRKGYKVTIFEAFDKAGGMLRYGIPAYRLPREVLDAEIQNILDLGVELKTNVSIGKDMPYEQLQKDFDAIFVGIGAHQGKGLRCPGEDAGNVYSGVKFLHLANNGIPVELGDKVVVIGGGDTAIDAARVAIRLGSKATILYRRTRNEMPAIEEEIIGAEEEGIDFHFLAAPIEIIQEDGKAVKMICQKMELGEPDASGRRRPVPIEGDTFELPVSTVIAAISQEPDFTGLDNLHEGRDWVKVDDFGKTKEDKTYGGGDVLDLGLATIALAQGRLAAETMHANFRGLELEKQVAPPVIKSDRILKSFYEDALRNEETQIPPEERLIDDPWKEISSTLSEEAVVAEAKRCMSCGSCFDCGTCWSYCQDNAIKKPMTPGEAYIFKLDFCNGCSKCKDACPCGYIEMK